MHFVHTSFRILMYTLFAPYTPYTQYATKVLFVNILVKIYFCVKNKEMSVVTFLILDCDILPVVLSFFKTFMGFSRPEEQLKQTVEANISCQKLDSVFMS